MIITYHHLKKLRFIKTINKNKPTTSDHRLSLGEYIVFGFNLICGISFITSYYTLLLSKSGNGLGLGYHLLWILVLEGVVAGISAWAFARLHRIHPNQNGASYLYTRTSLGRFMGWLVSVFLYTTMPLVIITHIVAMIRLNFISGKFEVHWGSYRSAYLDMIGMAIYGLAAMVIFVGFRFFKIIFKFTIYTKWILTGLLCAASIIIIVYQGGSGFVATARHSHVTVNTFSEAFTACFFFYTGFETFATLTTNIRNPEKTIPIGLVIIMSLTSLVMIVMTVLFIGALGASGFQTNSAVQIFNVLGIKLNSNALSIAGGVLMILWFITIKVTAAMENCLYSNTLLQPLAQEGYISERFAPVTHEDIANKAIRLNIMMNYLFFVFWLIIPDFIYGGLYGSQSPIGKDTFTYTDLTSAVSLFLFFVYFIVLIVAIKLSFENKMKFRKWEVGAWIVILGFIGFQIIEFFWKIFRLYDPAPGSTRNSEIVKPTIQLVFIFILTIYIFAWYFGYYWRKAKKRELKNPGYQKKLNSYFKLQDDWKYIAKQIDNDLSGYLKRNHKLYADHNNHTRKLATELQTMMKQYEDELKDD